MKAQPAEPPSAESMPREEALSPLERIVALLQGKPLDRIPYLLNAPMQVGRLLGCTPREQFERAEVAVEVQCELQRRLGNDLVTSFLHAAGEAEAFGGEIVWYTDGPPNAGLPPLQAPFEGLRAPSLDHPALALRIDVTRRLAARLGGRVPVVAGLVAPFSLPAMQVGLPPWFELLHEAPEVAQKLLAVNLEHCIAFSRAQFAAGANAVLAFEPLASPSLVSPALWRGYGRPLCRRFVEEAGGPVFLSTASAPALAVADDFASMGAALVGASEQDPFGALCEAVGGRAVVVGKLSGLLMRHWTVASTAEQVRHLLAALPDSVRVLIADQHGEIPPSVPLEVLAAAADALRRYGRYPLGARRA